MLLGIKVLTWVDIRQTDEVAQLRGGSMVNLNHQDSWISATPTGTVRCWHVVWRLLSSALQYILLGCAVVVYDQPVQR